MRLLVWSLSLAMMRRFRLLEISSRLELELALRSATTFPTRI